MWEGRRIWYGVSSCGRGGGVAAFEGACGRWWEVEVLVVLEGWKGGGLVVAVAVMVVIVMVD